MTTVIRDERIDTVFLDRDGTLNVKAQRGSYVTEPRQLVLMPGAATAIARLNRAGLRTVLVTNQRWMSVDYHAAREAFAAVQLRLAELLSTEGAWLDAVYCCPHPYRSCMCRKPAPGMLRRAARELGLNLVRSVIVGDAGTDMAAGRAVGAGTILIDATSDAQNPLADHTVPDLVRAVDLVIASSRRTDTASSASSMLTRHARHPARRLTFDTEDCS